MCYTRKDRCKDQGVNGKVGFANEAHYWGTFTVLPVISGLCLGLYCVAVVECSFTCIPLPCFLYKSRKLRDNIFYCVYLSRRQRDAKVILCRCSYRLLFRRIWTKLEFCGHSLENTHKLKFKQNPSNGGWVVPCRKTVGRAVAVKEVRVFFRSCCKDASKMDLKWVGCVPETGLM